MVIYKKEMLLFGPLSVQSVIIKIEQKLEISIVKAIIKNLIPSKMTTKFL